MWIFYYWTPQGKSIFQISEDRMSQILNGQNMHPHRNNGSPHGGRGNNGAPATGGAYLSLDQRGECVAFLPQTATYTEYVWNGPGLPAGMTRVIVGSDGSLWITWDHYQVYHRIHREQQGQHFTFDSQGNMSRRTDGGGTHTIFNY